MALLAEGNPAPMLRGVKQKAVLSTLKKMLDEGLVEPAVATVLEESGAAAATLESLEKHGLVTLGSRQVQRKPVEMTSAAPDLKPPHQLNGAQQAALDSLTGAIEQGSYRTFLLHGITGSGKTEVYIAALQEAIKRGRNGIILVPEIALTPQTVMRFRRHFGEAIAVMHSRMSLGERFDTWRCIQEGNYRVVIGPRSAILAPLENIGLIVVDEEHETSYKQMDPAPRYHARDTAVVRARASNAVCVLGSATPSLESLHNARSGKYELLELPERVPIPGIGVAKLPDIAVVDLILEQKKHRLNGALSDTLREAVTARMERQEQVILLQNRRGYAPAILCSNCRWTEQCPICSVTMTYHKALGRLRCHYCGTARPLPTECPQCGNPDLLQIGVGTQRVEEEVREVFPNARTIRMDMDTTAGRGAHFDLLNQFGSGEADILIGTQMVAKGLDFERVTLVGVINAGSGLIMPDFRAEERTFQLLTQVAGRAGRAERPGEVLLQTWQPDHPLMEFVVRHDYAGYAEWQLEERRVHNYPPYGRMIGLLFRGPHEGETRSLANLWTAGIRNRLSDPEVEVLGPSAAFIGKIMNQYRYHSVIRMGRLAARERTVRAIRNTREELGSPEQGFHVAVDVDLVGLF